MVGLDEEHELVPVVHGGFVQAPVIESGQSRPWSNKFEIQIGELRIKAFYRRRCTTNGLRQ